MQLKRLIYSGKVRLWLPWVRLEHNRMEINLHSQQIQCRLSKLNSCHSSHSGRDFLRSRWDLSWTWEAQVPFRQVPLSNQLVSFLSLHSKPQHHLLYYPECSRLKNKYKTSQRASLLNKWRVWASLSKRKLSLYPYQKRICGFSRILKKGKIV